LPKIPSKPVVE
jgi:tetratricopeptide (TPR) repeat protein